MNTKKIILTGIITLFSAGIGFYIGFTLHEQKTKIKINDIRDVQQLKVAAAFVRNPGQKFYQLDDPEKIREALVNREKKTLLYSYLQTLVLVFTEKDRYKIIEIPFEIGYDHFRCEYGTSKELKEYLKDIPNPKEMPSPFANQGPYPMQYSVQVSDSNDLKAPSPENR